MHSETCPEKVIDLNNKMMVQFIRRHLQEEADEEVDRDVNDMAHLIGDLFHDS